MTRLLNHLAVLFCLCLVAPAAEVPLFSTNAIWRLAKGVTEASSPDVALWRGNSFNDAAFSNAPAPFSYGEGMVTGTAMTGMQNTYASFFLRKAFVITNLTEVSSLRLGAMVDDGFIAWINGAEVRRVNMPGVAGDPVTITNLATGATEPVPFLFYTLTSVTNYLVAGTNTIAIQVFNTTLGSSDIVFDASLDATLAETNPPTILSATPAPGSFLTSLTQITVQFSEAVAGVDADDLTVGGVGATGVTGSGNTYTFTFPPAPYGNVPIYWEAAHGITDLAEPPNAFDRTGPGASWNYTLSDNLPPTVAALFPPSNSVLRLLGQIEVTFSEAVNGLDAGDLLVNGQPATNVLIQTGATFIFQFPVQADGPVTFSWAAGHGITDQGAVPNSFPGGSWACTVNSGASVGNIVINEINASNQSGTRDEDGEEQDWVELLNAGTNAVDLAGWGLSDDPDAPGRWVFPSRVLAPGQFLVVFCSGKDRRAPTGTNLFHTDFKLGGDGDYVGLFSPDSPRQFVSGFSPGFPEQRIDYSYGYDTGGTLRYFSVPTPGAANGASSITGVVANVHFSASRGHFTQPFNLFLSCTTKGSTIRYTTNGSEPTAGSGFLYTAPLNMNGTIFLRAAAFAPDRLSSKVSSHSYFFNQSALILSLPIISIQTASNNLLGPSGIIGIQGGTGPPSNPWTAVAPGDYHNPSQQGIAWERPMSVEYISSLDNSGFQIDCGMRVQGSAYTRPRYTPSSKFSYRLYFRGDYGAGRLEYPIFPDSAVQSFDQIVLRAGHNDISNPFLRDELVRQLSADMGQAASHGNYVNFFLNGVYKGYYNPCERIEEGFLQSWHGGGGSWDVITVGSVVQGGDNIAWNSLRNYVNGQDVTQPAVFSEILNRLDVVNFIDYLMVNTYAATWDWPHNNWRSARERAAGGRFRFYVWDAEGGFGATGRDPASFDSFSTTDSGLLTSTAEIPTLYQRLRLSPEFRLLWADRVQKHFYNGGSLMDSNVAARFIEQRAQLATVIPGFNNGVLTSWVPLRRAPLLGQYNSYGLFASSNAPVFNQHGSNVAAGFNLTMTAPGLGGTIYYTTNGSDPRVMFSGAAAPDAVAYSGPVPLQQSVLVKARALNAGNWSALTEASFAVAARGVPLRFTEINYNPVGGPAYEFIELQNTGTTPVNLAGLFLEGVTFTFPSGSSIAAGARLVLASDSSPVAFAVRYPAVTVAGYFGGGLDNAGERLVLKDAAGNIITSLDYDDDGLWPKSPDGAGYTLENINPSGDPDDAANWRASAAVSGTPGAANGVPASSAVRLNEALAENLGAVNHAGTFPDFIELQNTGGAPLNLEGWSFTDDGNARKFVFPPGTTISAGGFFTVWCDDTTNVTPGLHAGFSLDAGGETIYLYDPATNLVDTLTFGRQLANYSVGRIAGAWTLNNPTTNAANSAATLGSAASLSINEFLPNPSAGLPDWIELFNNSALPVSLRGAFLATTTAVHQITSLTFLPPYGFMQFFADEAPGLDHVDFKLPATGGSVILYSAAGTEVSRINYTAQPEAISRGRLPDGSATIVNFPGTPSPGATNYAATYTGPVINEVMARNLSAVTNGGRVADYFELHNGTGGPFALGGLSVSVDDVTPGQWTFPPGTTLAANSQLIIWCDNTRPASTNSGDFNTGRALNGDSGGVYLFNAAGQLVNFVEYGPQVPDMALGLVTGQWRLLASPSPGSANGAAAVLAAPTGLRFNEWMANSADGPDWFEIFNPAAQPVDLAGLVLTDDPTISGTNEFRVPALSFVAGGGFAQFIADGQPDQGRHHTSFSLDGEGDTLRLYPVMGTNAIHTVAFGLQVFGVSQGALPDGATNNLVSFSGSPTPGAANYRLINEIAINEALTRAALPLENAIELRNLTGDPVNIGGWYLSDRAANLLKFRIPDGTVVPAGGFVSFGESQFGTGPGAFTLNRLGGELWLAAADAFSNLNGFRTRASFGAADSDVSFGRHLVAGRAHFTAQAARTPTATNSAPLVGPVVINELLANPNGGSGAHEFIELRNLAPTNVSLFDPARPTNTWRLSGGVDYNLPPATTLAPGAFLLLVEFDPVADPVAALQFRARYSVPPAVVVLGPWRGQLDKAGDTIELARPGLPAGDVVPFVLVDRVRYGDSGAWPSDAGGSSLQRRDSAAYGDDAANWLAAAPTAGANNAAGGAGPVITLSPDAMNVLVNANVLLQAAATGPGPIAWQWRFNGSELPGATNATLGLEWIQLDEQGVYDAYARNAHGSAFTAPALVSVVQAPFVLGAPPAFVTTNVGASVAFTVNASGSLPLGYQWRLDDAPVPGATGPSLSLTNVALQHSGVYSLVITNPYGAHTASVTFAVGIIPVVTNHLKAVSVLQGGHAVFTLNAGPSHPVVPIGYRWIRGGTPYATTSVPVLVISNVQASATIRVVLTNIASSSVYSPGPSSLTSVALTMLPDGDADGMADAWETAYFGGTNAASPALDADGDGLSNRDEYAAGTNPTNAASVLRLALTATNQTRLEFVAQTNLSYTVLYRTNLAGGLWQSLSNVPAASLIRTIQLDAPNLPAPERYLRVVTPAVP